MKINVNGQTKELPKMEADTPLLYALRNDLDLTAPKFGCGLGQCGACTVHINGHATRSCVTPLSKIKATDKIVTLEGLGHGKRTALQEAFIEEQAVQCGYCINGMIMVSAELLEKTPHPTEDDIKTALAANLCRCGTHLRIIKAVQRAAKSPVRSAEKSENRA